MKKLLITGVLLSSHLYGQNAPLMYRFTTDYYFLDTRGTVGHREQVVGMYTRDFGKNKAKWNAVTAASTTKSSEAFGPPEKQQFMEGFTYPMGAIDTTNPQFFATIPPQAIQERSLVWDTQMFEVFGEQQFRNLKPGVTRHVSGPASIPLAGAGTFQNKDVQLVLTGTAKCDGLDCAVIDYRAFFNALELKMPKETLTGRSHYWGQIWVSLRTQRIVRATLYEDVLGEVSAPGLQKPQPVNVFRIGVLEPVKE